MDWIYDYLGLHICCRCYCLHKVFDHMALLISNRFDGMLYLFVYLELLVSGKLVCPHWVFDYLELLILNITNCLQDVCGYLKVLIVNIWSGLSLTDLSICTEYFNIWRCLFPKYLTKVIYYLELFISNRFDYMPWNLIIWSCWSLTDLNICSCLFPTHRIICPKYFIIWSCIFRQQIWYFCWQQIWLFAPSI